MVEKKIRDLDEIKKGVGEISMPPGSEDIPSPEIPDVPSAEETEESYSPEPSAPEIPIVIQQPMPAASQQLNISERIHEVAEAIIDERWEEFNKKVGDVAVWKEKMNMNVVSVKQEVLRMQERFENLQKSVIGKVSEYDQGIREVHTEMKALEKVFERILEPLVSNVKELNKITEELKKIRK